MISQTTDIDFIIKCVTNPHVWNASADDGCGDPDLFFLELDRKVIWVRSDDDGVFMLHPHNRTTYEVHTLLLPHVVGRGVEIGKQALQWAWDNTPAERIVTNVPEFNLLALRYAKKMGFEQYGFNPKSFKRDGVLYGQTLLGISKGETSCQ